MKKTFFLTCSLMILVILITTFSKSYAQKASDLLGYWDFEKIAKNNIINEQAVKERAKIFKAASFNFLKDETYTLKFSDGYVLKGNYELEDDNNNKLQLGTQHDNSEINGFMDSYVYQLVFLDKNRFLLKFYGVSFDEEPLYQMQFKRRKPKK